MSDADRAPEFRVDELLMALARHDVRFLVVGGVACQLYGATRLTSDLDICPACSLANFERLAAALEELGAVLRLRPELGDVRVVPSAELLRQVSVSPWRTPVGDLDVLIAISAGDGGRAVGFRELYPRATAIHVGTDEILVAALEDIVRSKEHAGRAKDREALPELVSLLAARKAESDETACEQVQRRGGVESSDSAKRSQSTLPLRSPYLPLTRGPSL